MRRHDYGEWRVSDLEILHQDDRLLVVSKPGGMLVHNGWGNDPVVLIDLVKEITGKSAHPVHRLDRQTSGVIAIPLDNESAGRLGKSFQRRDVEKRYLAMIRGTVPSEGLINYAIPRKKGGDRRPAVTRFRRLASAQNATVVEALPKTGRMHQIRRHFKHIRHPLLGDSNYGSGRLNREYRKRFNLNRLALHAWLLSFVHPITGERMTFTAALPPDLRDVFGRMGLDIDGLL